MSIVQEDLAVAPGLTWGLRAVTEAAARAAWDCIGQGNKCQGDRAAIDAMGDGLDRLGINGLLVIGEGSQEESPRLYSGERIGDPAQPPRYDIAVDPVEGTSYLAKGMTNAMAVIAMAPHGSLFDPGPAFYMEKFAGPPQVRGLIDPDSPVEEKLNVLSRTLGKKVGELTIYVLEKPRHRDLVERLHRAGARVALYPAGDVAGAVMAAIPNSGIDALMGTGGTPEGMLSACAIRAMGGEFLGRIDPQLASEKLAVLEQGMDIQRWWRCEELVTSDQVHFCATGITTGLLLEGVERCQDSEKTHTMMVSGTTGERQFLTTYHRLRKAGAD
ncbi:class II fructose-bisphosphatase [Telmatospirillum sp. J64-1]|uniref:class II fructose-bisphosphatase n=1 Tax=Telmatospirillum sp. J64-1 TaxID=2502183 RepID=UPI00115E2A79|nr:class II fructose-bisphosphatase [Telmatospirillum sp. J64-1]